MHSLYMIISTSVFVECQSGNVLGVA